MNIFIGCSSSDNINKIYTNLSQKLAKYLANKNYNLLIGGVSGLMGTIIDIFEKEKNNINIYCVEKYYDIIDRNLKKQTFNTVNERKNAIIKDADIFIILPGGIGTIDEMFSIIEAKRANQHHKPIIILNINNYYDNLIKMLEKIYQDNFSYINNKKIYKITNSIDETIKYIESSDI